MRSWSLLLDASVADPAALARLTPETLAAIAAERIRLAATTPGHLISVNISVHSYAGKTLRFLKTPGFIAPVTAIFAVLGWGNALDDERKALKNEEGRALSTLVAAYAGLGASAFEVLKVSIEGAAARRLPLLGPVGRALSGRFLRLVSVGGAGAGAAGMWIAVGVDFFNVHEAWQGGEQGMVVLYVARGLSEATLAVNMSWSLYALVVDGAAAELLGGPVVWVLTGCIVVVSVIIDLAKDPETLKWTSHCYFGAEPEYDDDSAREQKDFVNAIASK